MPAGRDPLSPVPMGSLNRPGPGSNRVDRRRLGGSLGTAPPAWAAGSRTGPWLTRPGPRDPFKAQGNTAQAGLIALPDLLLMTVIEIDELKRLRGLFAGQVQVDLAALRRHDPMPLAYPAPRVGDHRRFLFSRSAAESLLPGSRRLQGRKVPASITERAVIRRAAMPASRVTGR